jgi:F-type H+-transporting ATPase subunit b
LEKLGINIGYFLVQTFNFLILLVVLRVWVYKPIVNMLEKRRQNIAQGLEDARVAAEARANAEKEAEKIIADANRQASQVVAEAKDRAEVAARDVRATAEAEAVKTREKALTEVEEERNRILGDLRGQIAGISIAAAQKLVGEALDEKRQHSLLAEFFSGVKSGKVVVLEGSTFKGASAEVTSALPLTADELTTVKNEILSKSGADAVTFRVDPTILGGLVVRVGDKVLDGSVAGKLEGLRASLH